MRIWTVHPQYLDRQGLIALWREGLLAQRVLLGQTKGYRNHPQLVRFKKQKDPVAAIATYLTEIHGEAERRRYRFDKTKICPRKTKEKLVATRGQLLYEWEHLKRKILMRVGCPRVICSGTTLPSAHPLFRIVAGGVSSCEKVNQAKAEPTAARRRGKPRG